MPVLSRKERCEMDVSVLATIAFTVIPTMVIIGMYFALAKKK